MSDDPPDDRIISPPLCRITTYDPQGHLLAAKTVGAINDITTAPHGLYVEGLYDSDEFYVVDGQAVERPPNPTVVSGMTLHNVPLHAQIDIDRTVYSASESTVELRFPVPGRYVVSVISFPFRDFKHTFVTE